MHFMQLWLELTLGSQVFVQKFPKNVNCEDFVTRFVNINNHTHHFLHWVVKFIYSEKAPKFSKIFTLLLTVCTLVKIKVKILQNFVALSEYMNSKGQIISKCLFGVCQETNENTSHTKWIHSIIFWNNSQLDNLLSKLTDL